MQHLQQFRKWFVYGESTSNVLLFVKTEKANAYQIILPSNTAYG